MTGETRLVRRTTLDVLLDTAIGFYALNVLFQQPGLCLDEDVEQVLREAIREAADLLGRASEPRIASILAAYAPETPENVQKAPENAHKAKKSPKKG